MKIYDQRQRREPGKFSGKIEVVFTRINTEGKRMSGLNNRRTIRLEETTLEEVYQILYVALNREVL